MRHRGAHPDDARLFDTSRLPRLRRAAEEAAWLLGRDYSLDTALGAVVAHHQLEARQRLALRRSVVAPAVAEARRGRALTRDAAAGRVLLVDGFNLVITLEVALGGGPLFLGHDGALRDLAGLRGSYHPVVETAGAIELFAAACARLGVAAVHVWLDAPVSNSGRLRAQLLDAAPRVGAPLTVELAGDVDGALAGGEAVVSADALVLDRARSWVNLARWIVDDAIPAAWIVAL